MSPEGTEIRAVVFGDLERGAWGAALDAGGAFAALGRLAPGASFSIASAGFGDGSTEGSWGAGDAGSELRIEPSGDGFRHEGVVTERCSVHLDTGPGRGELPGVRWSVAGADLGELDSLRAVGGAVSTAGAVAALALRPRGREDHGGDRIAGSMFDEGEAAPVTEARLSTTYGPDGWPARLSLELWRGEGETEYPQRAAGDALAQERERAESERLVVLATAVRLHSRGPESLAVYLLARPR